MIRIGKRRSAGFAQIPNDTLRDSRLTYRARGVLGDLLSHAEGWSTSAERLAQGSPAGQEGRDSIRKALSELERYGYIAREKVRDERGRIRTEYVIYEEPQPQIVEERGEEQPVDSTNRRSGEKVTWDPAKTSSETQIVDRKSTPKTVANQASADQTSADQASLRTLDENTKNTPPPPYEPPPLRSGVSTGSVPPASPWDELPVPEGWWSLSFRPHAEAYKAALANYPDSDPYERTVAYITWSRAKERDMTSQGWIRFMQSEQKRVDDKRREGVWGPDDYRREREKEKGMTMEEEMQQLVIAARDMRPPGRAARLNTLIAQGVPLPEEDQAWLNEWSGA